MSREAVERFRAGAGMSEQRPPTVKMTVEFSARPRDVEELPNGDVLYRRADVTMLNGRPIRQVRDITVRADGSVHLGANQSTRAALGETP